MTLGNRGKLTRCLVQTAPRSFVIMVELVITPTRTMQRVSLFRLNAQGQIIAAGRENFVNYYQGKSACMMITPAIWVLVDLIMYRNRFILIKV